MHATQQTKASGMMRTTVTAIAAAVFTLGAAVAAAQPACPMGGGGPGMHAGYGMRAGQGPGPGAGGGMMFLQAFEQAKAQLNLNTQQQQMWDAAVAEGKTAFQAAVANRQQMKAALAAELAKTEPDLRALAAAKDAMQAQNQAQRHKVRDLWLNLYATFTVDQKAVVRQLMQDRLARMEARRAQVAPAR